MLLALLAAACLLLFLLTAWRPAIGCVVLVVSVFMTTGLPRGALVPLLKPNEALLLVVAAGLLLHAVRRPQRRPLVTLDFAMGGFAIGVTLVPLLVLFLSHAPQLTDFDTLRVVLGPIQLFAIYLVFSRSALTDRLTILLLNLAMLAGVIVGVIAIAQLVNVGGIRGIVETYYPSALANAPWDPVYRPSSTLGHYSAVGAFAVFHYTLALALAMARHPAFNRHWLSFVMVVNVGAAIASLTWAPLIVLPLGTLVIVWYGRHIPRQLTMVAVGLGLAFILLWPSISARGTQQGVLSAGSQGFTVPATMQVRMRLWSEFFIPALQGSVLLGTGATMPSEVPDRLVPFIDNEYLYEAFRAGLVGVGLLLWMLVAIGAVAWRRRDSADPMARALGGAAVATVLCLAVISLTAQYLNFGGVSQSFGMLVGLLAVATRGRAAQSPPAAIVQLPRARAGRSIAHVSAWLGRIAPEATLLRSSLILFAGTSAARLLGFLFSVAAARMLLPSGFGQMAYALTIAVICSVLLPNAATGLARFLARHQGHRVEQEGYYSNWMAVVLIMLMVSLVLSIPLSLVAGLSGWMVGAVVANVLGFAVWFTYREVQRGQERYVAMAAFCILANVLQLIAIVIAAVLGLRNAALFLTLYGLSNLWALALMERIAPVGLRFLRGALQWHRILAIGRFIRPLVLATIFNAVWMWIDLILVQRMLPAAATGNYAAAKTAVNVLVLAPTAIGIAVGPRIARLAEKNVTRYLLSVLGLTAIATAPALAAIVLLRGPLMLLLFGARYPDAAAPLTMLAVGVALYGFYLVFQSMWIGLGRPFIDSIAAGAAMVSSAGAGLILVPHGGLIGAATAYAIGSAAQLGIIAAFSIVVLTRGKAIHGLSLEAGSLKRMPQAS